MPNTSTSTSVDTTKTTTATSSRQGRPARRPGPVSGPSSLELAASQWAAMTPEQQNTFAQLTNTMANAKEPTLPNRLSAYNTYVALSSANIAANKPLGTEAKPYVAVPLVPDTDVHASYVNGTLHVTLTPAANVPYPYTVAVKMAPVILAASDLYNFKSFKKIGAITSFSGTVDITEMVLSRYHISGPGYKIALELVGVAPGGFHSSKRFVFGVVGNVAAEAALTEPEDTTPEPEASKLELG